MKKINPYYQFLQKLLDNERITANGFQEKYGIRSFSAIFNKLKNTPDKSLHPETIGKIEEALKIRIDDSDLENITFKKISHANEVEIINKTENSFPVLLEVYAGDSPMLFVQENISDYVSFPYPKTERCFVVKVIGDSMNGTIAEGDLILVDMNKDLQNGKVVVARLKDGRQVVKRYRELPNDLIILYSDNSNYEPITIHKSQVEAVYRVVAITRLNF